MNARIVILLSALFAWLCLPLHAVQLGDTRAAVITEMGQPVGEVTADSSNILIYPRGEIRLRAGLVSGIHLLNDEEFKSLLDNGGSKTVPREIERTAKLEAEGRRLLRARTHDAAFLARPAGQQLDFWRSFAVCYPMIPIDTEVSAVLEKMQRNERPASVHGNSDTNRFARAPAPTTPADQHASPLSRSFAGSMNAWTHPDGVPLPISPEDEEAHSGASLRDRLASRARAALVSPGSEDVPQPDYRQLSL